jgi:glucose/mannose transport system substrate-binding protein
MTPRSIRPVLVAASLFAVVACDAQEDDSPRTVEIFSWWVEGGEVQALDALLAVHREHFPSTEVINAAAQDSQNARALLDTRFAQGFPPDTFQANAGPDLLRWVESDESHDLGSKLEPLDWLYEEQFGGAIPEAVIDSVSHDGVPYSVPLNLHRNNSLFYNMHVLAEHDLAVPTTLDELHVACETLAAADVPCFAVGGNEPWTLSLLTWENLLIAVAGAQYQYDFLHGAAAPTDDEVGALADELLRIWSYAHPSSPSDGWVTAVERVGRGEAAMTVMGDWAKGLLVANGLVAGTDFGQAAFPGTNGIFVFNSDTFPMPKGATSRDAAIELLRTMVSPEGQIAFNTRKGSIPVRTDVDDSDFDVLGKRMMAEFRDADRLVLAEADRFAAMENYLQQTVLSGDRDLFVNGVRDLYDVLQ